MKNIIRDIVAILFLSLVLCQIVLSQDSAKIVKESTEPCRLSKADLPVRAGIKLGASVAEMRKVFPAMAESSRSPFRGTTAFTVKSAISNISLIVLAFSQHDSLVGYSLYYEPKKWKSIDEPFKRASNEMGIVFPRESQTLWLKGKDETITVDCSDFASVSRFGPLSEDPAGVSPERTFFFSIADNSTLGSVPKRSDSTDVKVQPQDKPFSFPAEPAEYTITFPGRPTIKTIETETGPVDQATLVLPDGSGLRAEYGPASPETLATMAGLPDQKLRDMGLMIGKTAGYILTTSSVGRTELGLILIVKGNKVLNGRSVNFEHRIFYGKRSIMTVITSGSTSEYSTKQMLEFLDSLKRTLE